MTSSTNKILKHGLKAVENVSVNGSDDAVLIFWKGMLGIALPTSEGWSAKILNFSALVPAAATTRVVITSYFHDLSVKRETVERGLREQLAQITWKVEDGIDAPVVIQHPEDRIRFTKHCRSY